jgi:hypothetical protein
MEWKRDKHTTDGRVEREKEEKKESDVLARHQVRNEGMVFLMTHGNQSLMGEKIELKLNGDAATKTVTANSI